MAKNKNMKNENRWNGTDYLHGQSMINAGDLDQPLSYFFSGILLVFSMLCLILLI